MSLRNWFSAHRHYWGVPHRAAGGRVIQVCYECGKQRESILGAKPSSKPPDVAVKRRVMRAVGRRP